LAEAAVRNDGQVQAAAGLNPTPGVILHLHAEREALMLSLGGDAIAISMK